MNDENDENNCVSSENFEITNDDVDENDDEIRSKKKITRIVLRFFFFSIDDNIFERKRTSKIAFRFFFFSVNDKTLENKKTTKIVFRFFFFSFEREMSNDDMTTTDESDDDNVEN
jgi:hypothetical protein